MAYKCRICDSNEVGSQGGICELCAISYDPYADGAGSYRASSNQYIDTSSPSCNGQLSKRGTNRRILLNGGASVVNCDPYGNDITSSQSASSVQVYSPGQISTNTNQGAKQMNPAVPRVSAPGSQPEATGITKNITVDNQKKPFLVKWLRALFCGIPFTLDDDVTMFQVFPDYTGTSLNTLGNACDQIIVYGRINSGLISENNDVEVYGRRDSHNNIIAKTIKNKASGTTITPQHSIGAGTVWALTAFIITLIAAAAMSLGATGITWVAVILICLLNIKGIIKLIGTLVGSFFSSLKKRY